MATRDVVPRADKEGSLGTSAKKWVMVWQYGTAGAVVASDVTTTNLTATDITGMTFAIGASETWSFEFHAKIGSSSAAGTKYAVDIPASATIMGQVWGSLGSTTAYTQDTVSADTTLGVAFNTAGLTTAAQGANLHIYGVVVNSTNAGNVTIQHAKVTSGTSTVYANSYFVARRIS